ncbi:MAG: hypothetical protein JWO08_119 [Verrucomicrobiaceae bacterium]|nr:hypothetical protein [Verrucomicrobiaceae bacterium]
MKKDDPYEGLIFRWRAPEGVRLRLVMWGLLALVGMGLWLLLFEVVYPAPSHRSKTTQRITVLDASSPKAKEVIAWVTDRNFLLLAPSANSTPSLSDLRPVFSPGFKGFELQVKDLPETGAAASELPRLFGPDHPMLPPVTTAKLATAPAQNRKVRLVAVPSAGLEGRPVLHDIEPLPAGSPALAEINARFRVAVSPAGRVLTAVSLMDESSDASAAVARAFRESLDQLRFAPATSTGPQWGVIAFRWKGGGS